MSTKVTGGRLGDHEPATAVDAGETFAAEESAGSAVVGSTGKQKVCCVCGTNLVGEKRYKDAEGRYWCVDCTKADAEKKQPAACADCHQQLTVSELTAFEGVKVCQNCLVKRQHAAKRAAQRKAAAEEEARLQRKRYRVTLFAAGASAALMVAYLVFRLLR